MIGTVEEFRYRLEKAMNIRGLRPIDICNSTGIYQSTLSQYRSGARGQTENLKRCTNPSGPVVVDGWILLCVPRK